LAGIIFLRYSTRRVQHLTVAPLTSTPPLEPSLGDTLLKAFKAWLSK
jgi:hypothetical protein